MTAAIAAVAASAAPETFSSVSAASAASAVSIRYGVPTVTGVTDLNEWVDALLQPTALAELVIVGVGLLAAYGITKRFMARSRQPSRVWFGEHGIDGVLFPLLALLAAVAARYALANVMPVAVLRVAVPVLASLAVIRVGVRVLRVAFPASPLVRSFETTLSWFVWVLLVLWLTGLLPLVREELDAMQWKVAGSEVSLRSLIEGAFTALAVMVLMLWLSAAIESHLLKEGVGNISMRKIAANLTRAVLLLTGVLLALSAAGIPLAALSVMGGAVGVGLGLGFQKLAANYVSGFVILAERSLKIGDVVKADGFEGRISDINTRYTLIRALNGREAIVPNELLITQRVENLTAADPKVALNTTVRVVYGTDLHALIPQLVAAIATVPRVLRDPGPGVHVTNLAPDGIELTTGFWIDDPQEGQSPVQSDVNIAVLDCLARLGVEIAYPQRVLQYLNDRRDAQGERKG